LGKGRQTAAMWRQRLEQVIAWSTTAFKWGWIPFILYLGKPDLTKNLMTLVFVKSILLQALQEEPQMPACPNLTYSSMYWCICDK
jgi:hypothetical protein